MENNKAFIIAIQTEIGECYLGQRDGVMSKIKGAVFYHDDMYANYELNRIKSEYKNNPFFIDESKLSIKKVEINIL